MFWRLFACCFICVPFVFPMRLSDELHVSRAVDEYRKSICTYPGIRLMTSQPHCLAVVFVWGGPSPPSSLSALGRSQPLITCSLLAARSPASVLTPSSLHLPSQQTSSAKNPSRDASSTAGGSNAHVKITTQHLRNGARHLQSCL